MTALLLREGVCVRACVRVRARVHVRARVTLPAVRPALAGAAAVRSPAGVAPPPAAYVCTPEPIAAERTHPREGGRGGQSEHSGERRGRTRTEGGGRAGWREGTERRDKREMTEQIRVEGKGQGQAGGD